MVSFINVSFTLELLGSNLYTNTQDDDAGTKIAQFLTEEKNYESVTSKYPRTSHQDLDNESKFFSLH